MTQEQILEGNKLIALFMGAKVHQAYSDTQGLSGLMFYYEKDTSPEIFRNLPLSAIKYHSSWDWLIPVIRKAKMTLGSDGWNRWHTLNHELCRCEDPRDVFFLVVQFVEWYESIEL